MSHRYRQKQRQESAPARPPAQPAGPQPIKVLAIGLAVLLVLAAIVTFAFNNANASRTTAGTATRTTASGAAQQLGGTLAPVNNGVQDVSVSMRSGQYQPYPIRVKAGTPVRMTVDLATVRGCYRSIIIPELGVSGRASDGNNVITFTPTKAGTFRMTCSMGMADGTLIVEDANGNAPPSTAPAVPLRVAGGGSCGAGGGCGCGG